MEKKEERIIREESIDILGIKGTDYDISEADVLYEDNYGDQWYVTIETPINFVKRLIQIDEDDFMGGEDYTNENIEVLEKTNVEEKRLVWNDNLDIDKIRKIIMSIKGEALEGFSVKVEDDSNNNY